MAEYGQQCARAAIEADRQSRDCGQCVPLSTDGKSVFIDGLGEVPLDFGGQARGNADASTVSSEPVAWISDSPTKGNGKRLFWTKTDAWSWSSNVKPLHTASQPEQIPEGYKVVPIEPTDDMLEAVCTGDESQPGKSAYEVISERYKAMLEAAPEPKEQ